MAEKHTVAMFIQDENGERVQVGWASPKDSSGVRTFEYSPGFESTRPRDVSFEDDELTQKIAEEQHEARVGSGLDGEEFEVEVSGVFVEPVEVTPTSPEPVDASVDETKDAERVEDAPDAEQADDPTDASVELYSGGEIVETADEDEEAEFARLLAQEQAESDADTNVEDEQPQTRRELREVTDLLDEDIDEN